MTFKRFSASMDTFAVFLGASKNAKYPTKIISASSAGLIWFCCPTFFCATAMTFMPSCSISSTTEETLSLASSMGSTLPRYAT